MTQDEQNKIISELSGKKPEVKIDENFKRQLRAKILNRVMEIQTEKTGKKLGFWHFLVLPRTSFLYAASLLIILAIIFIPSLYLFDKIPQEKSGAPVLAPSVPAAPLPSSFSDKSSEKLDSERAAIVNPASVNCLEQGGRFENRVLREGETGFCVFSDGSECEEWKFFREECKKGERFCRDLCGDSVCQEIVCEALGCPCVETKTDCPADCP